MASSGGDRSSPDNSDRSNALPILAALVLVAAVALGILWTQDGGDPDQRSDDERSAPASVPFMDARASLGVDFAHVNGATGDKLLPETGGSGCAWFDYDADGDPDLLLLNGRPWPWDEATKPPRNAIALYRNDEGRFVDVTDEAGLAADFYGQGAAVGDYDGDGDDDLYFTSLGPSRMFRNDDGRFVDVTRDVNLAGNPNDWTTSAGFFDYDRDGDLDLFVCNYLRWTRELDDAANFRLEGAGRSYAHPLNFPGANNYLYRNDDGVFSDVTVEAGIEVVDDEGEPLGKALAVTFTDVDRDGWLDVCVANDTVRHFLFRNQRDGSFEEVGQELGFAVNAAGQTTSGMGIDAAAIDDATRPVIAIGNFAAEMTSLYLVGGDSGAMVDETTSLGVGAASRDSLTFGLLFDDFDLDGRPDLVHANGHLEETINAKHANQQYAQAAQLFWNAGPDAQQRFVELDADAVGDLAKPAVGRALASADFDQDGDLDLVVTQVNGQPLLLRNEQTSNHHWLRCRLVGPTGNPHAYGATVKLAAGGRTQRRVVMPTRSYMSQSEPVATFGLGDADAVGSLTVTWPDGSQQEVGPVQVDQVLTIRQETESFYTLANRAKAELENGQFDAAIDLLTRSITEQPDSLPMQRNLARAYIQNGQQEEALAQLATMQDGPDVAYMRGLAQLKSSHFEDAAASFQQAAQLDPNEATFRYQWALALLPQNLTDEARAQLEKTVELDPLHGSAQYQLATLARKAGDQAAATEYLRDYQRIIKLKGQISALALEACKYTVPEAPDLARSTTVEVPETPLNFRAIEIAAEGIPPIAAAAVHTLNDSGRYTLAAIGTGGELVMIDFDADGQPTVSARVQNAVAPTEGSAQLLIANALVDPPPQDPSLDEGDQPELAIVTKEQTRLIRYSPARGAVEDLTAAAGLSDAGGPAAQWIDADHDGDVDLCFATDAGLVIWRNNGDGTVVNASSEFGVEASDAATDLDAADFDGTNLGTDVVLVGGSGAQMLRNQMSGQFAEDADAAAAWPAAKFIEVDDFDNDGLPDCVFAEVSSATLYITGKTDAQRIELPFDQLDVVATIDAEADGWLDLVIAGSQDSQAKLMLFRNAGGQFADAPVEITPAGMTSVRGILDFDVDGDCDADLMILHTEGQVSQLLNETATENKHQKLTLHSFAGHPSSIGVRTQVRSEAHLVTRWTDRELPIEIGMGRQPVADSVQTLWVNGVFRNELDIPIACEPLHVIVIEFVRTDSCPFLYAKVDGGWQFMTDLLGTAPLNVVVARGVPAPTDSDELFVLGPADQFADANLAAKLRITSELRETIYLDRLQLLAVDHPAETTIFSRDRVATTGVDGPQYLLGSDPVAPISAVGSDGVDRTADVATRDGRFAPPGRVLPYPAVGFTDPLSVEFDFGDLDPEQDLLLALTGWFRFGNASTNIAASQRGDLQVIWPRLEALDAAGNWVVVDDMVGFPAGNTKTIVCDLSGKLPAATQRLRLTTTFEVRWDQIALYQKADSNQATTSFVDPSAADLAWHGFHELRAASPDQPHLPNLSQRFDTPPWQTAIEGWSTRYGDVLPLVDLADQRFAILNSGDGATIEFSADALPPREDDAKRTLLLYTHGWIKAGDPNCSPGLTVAPFPGSEAGSETPEDDWQLEFNTRFTPRNRFGDPEKVR